MELELQPKRSGLRVSKEGRERERRDVGIAPGRNAREKRGRGRH